MNEQLSFAEGKAKFIEQWGTIGSKWGINRTMAMIHALLLVSPHPLSAEDVMQQLSISRGNANMNLRALIDWNLIYKSIKPGERREYFVAEKDMYRIIKAVIVQRKKRELEPLLRLFEEMQHIEGDRPEEREFRNVVRDIQHFSNRAENVLDMLVHANTDWFINNLFKVSSQESPAASFPEKEPAK